MQSTYLTTSMRPTHLVLRLHHPVLWVLTTISTTLKLHSAAKCPKTITYKSTRTRMSSQDLVHVAPLDPTASQAFVHKPLSSPRPFRVLELLPSRDFDSTVSCEIREASLDDHVKYEALSYVWGAPTPGFAVSVGDKTLAVMPNCLEALHTCVPGAGAEYYGSMRSVLTNGRTTKAQGIATTRSH